ncbi:hypothetical protein [Croceiramulus getboli]|nr:hypothetical protein P8624_11215 [Flavobacteriaceae bacterium YJPT1-3]
MKYYFYFICLLFIFSCSGDDSLSISSFGKVSASIDGYNWTGEIISFTSNVNDPSKFDMNIKSNQSIEGVEEFLSFQRIASVEFPQRVYSLDLDSSFADSLRASLTTVLGGDAIDDLYYIDSENNTSFIQIIESDKDKLEVKGIFYCDFELERDGSTDSDSNPPQELLFADGQFTAKVPASWFDN